MASPRTGTCAPWATPADLPASCNAYGVDAGVQADALQFASDTLFLLSGRRWPGVCTATVRPCSRSTAGSLLGWSIPFGGTGAGGAPFGPFGYVGSWGEACGCNAVDSCGCGSLPSITLGAEPVVSIDQVKIDGNVLSPSLYRVDNYRELVRVAAADGSNPGWPCCQRMDLADTHVGTWSVTFKYGGTPPVGGVLAAGVLACEIMKAIDPSLGECSLPSRATSITRQGVTVQLLDPMQVFAEGLTGIALVDGWLRSVNPHKLSRRSRVWSPDVARRTRKAGT